MATAPQRTVPSGEHLIPERHSHPHDNRRVHAIIGLLLVLLALIGLVVYGQPQDNGVAGRRAAQLEQLLRQDGLSAPSSRDLIVNSLGTDGGAVCKTPSYALPAAILDWQFAAGGGGVAARPIPVARVILQSQLAIIHIYCPGRTPAFLKYFREYKLYPVVRR